MSYMGNQPPDIGAYDVESFNGGGTSFTLKRSATVSSVLLFIDGVRQTPTDAYTVSGVTLTTIGTTPSGTDNVTVMFMGDVVDIGAPSADTVSTAKIQDDAVTAAKLANSINTEITANTAKVTNATHTGDVTGATALTIAVDAVDIAMLSATGTASATTFLRGDNAWAAVAGGLTIADQWRLTTSFTGTSSPITSNLERVDTAQQATLGSAMTESSGVFTFPETGYYFIMATLSGRTSSGGSERSHGINIDATIDDSTYVTIANSSNSGFNSGDSTDYSGQCQGIVDVTDAANVKVRFRVSVVTAGSSTMGDTAENKTTFTFIKLADT